jgi:hypothetical protein
MYSKILTKLTVGDALDGAHSLGTFRCTTNGYITEKLIGEFYPSTLDSKIKLQRKYTALNILYFASSHSSPSYTGFSIHDGRGMPQVYLAPTETMAQWSSG